MLYTYKHVICLELLMCAMSVQDVLAGKSNGETKLNPMYYLWKLCRMYFNCIVRCMDVSFCN